MHGLKYGQSNLLKGQYYNIPRTCLLRRFSSSPTSNSYDFLDIFYLENCSNFGLKCQVATFLLSDARFYSV